MPTRLKGERDEVKQARRAQSWPEGLPPRSRGPKGPLTSSLRYSELKYFRCTSTVCRGWRIFKGERGCREYKVDAKHTEGKKLNKKTLKKEAA